MTIPDFADAPRGLPIDVQSVRQAFSDPSRVVGSQFLRREVAQRMHERLSLVKLNPRTILDAGCGEGADLPVLRQRYVDADVIGVDASFPMLDQARRLHAGASTSLARMLAGWLPGATSFAARAGLPLALADFSRLPIAHASVDLLWSNLALHWHPQPDLVLAEWRRVLRNEGLLMFSCFGPDTFKEVRAAFAAADAAPHVLPFVDMHDLGDMLIHAGFATPVMDMESIVLTYDDAAKLLADVRAWGGNPRTDRRRGLLGAAAWQRARQALEAGRRADGKLGLTVEVVYGHAFRPVPRTTAAGEAIVRLDWPRRAR